MKKILLSSIITIIIGSGLFFSLNGQKFTHANNSADINQFVVANYNIENGFDLVANGSEYAEFIPNFKGWDRASFEKKFNNIAKVISDMNPDVIAIEEIENENALNELKKRLDARGVHYAYYAITSNKQSAVQVAVLSKFCIVDKQELRLASQKRERPILKLTLDIGGNHLIVYANHWKAKTGPESMRLEYARVLMSDIVSLPRGSDYIVLGDLNSNYNEFETITREQRVNDTAGVTAINDILKTITTKNGIKKVADKVDVVADGSDSLRYNLWLEIPKNDRMSETFGKERDTPDNIIIPKAMFDKKGISYVDGSFGVFSPSYLLDKNGRPFRWEGKDRHGNIKPDGYSDHLPIFARFSVKPFEVEQKNSPTAQTQAKPLDTKKAPGQITISQIYDKNITGKSDFILRGCVVIGKNKGGVIVKQQNSRAIFVYDPPFDMKLGFSYDLRVTNIVEYKGLKEIKTIFDAKENGKAEYGKLILKYSNQDLSASEFQNEIVTGVEGYISRGKFVYGGDKEIGIYFADKRLKPKNLTKILIKRAQVGYYEKPQLVISSDTDFAVIE